MANGQIGQLVSNTFVAGTSHLAAACLALRIEEAKYAAALFRSNPGAAHL